MERNGKLKKLRTLQAEIDKIRGELSVSGRDEVLYRASLYVDTDEEVLVIADGFGGATASVVEGNYPIDFFTRHEKAFESEGAAIEAADKLIEEGATVAQVFS